MHASYGAPPAGLSRLNISAGTANMVKIFKVFVPVSVLVLLVCETAILYGCYVAGVYLAQAMFEGPLFAAGFLWDDNGFVRILIAVATIMLGLYFNDLYESFQIRSRIQLIQQVCLAVGVAFFTQAFMGYLVTGWIVPRYTMILGSTIVLIVLPPFRILYATLVFRAFGAEQILFLGSSITLQELAKGIEEKPTMGLKIIGFLDDGAGGDEPLPGITRLGTIQDLAKVLDPRPNRIVVGLTERRNRLPIQELLELRFSGIRIEEATQLYEAAFGRVCTREFRPSQLIFSEDLGPRSGSETLQSVYCFVFAVVLLILTSPLMLLVALAVRLTSPGPILLRQKRVGRGDAVFTVYKFRSMYEDAEARTGAVWATRNDPRITPVGRVIRRLRLDEVPQLFNVLKGEMAIAGPRPERPEFVKTLSEMIPYYRQRHCVKPGITGWAQINYKYGDTIEDTIAKLEYDLYYIKHLSVSLDAYIFFHTVKTMLLSRGAQ
jgi:sugar transferase (PEP-CTERM system associated)